MLFSLRLERGLRRASTWHANQTRKGSAIPYIEHVVGTAMVLDRAGFDEDVVLAGLLHDSVEDAGVSLDEIAEEFGPVVAGLVGWCSEVKLDENGSKRPWLDRKTDHLSALADAPIDAKAVVLADKLHNLTAIAVDLAEGREVWSLFNAGRDQVLRYYEASLAVCGRGDPRLERLAADCRTILAEIADANHVVEEVSGKSSQKNG